MPRQSRVDKVLADRETELEREVAQAAAAAEQKANELKSVRDLRKRLAAEAPKRGRAKIRAATTAELLAKARAEQARGLVGTPAPPDDGVATPA